jgi:glycosyltransferase involved in cell wall biosynthesis
MRESLSIVVPIHRSKKTLPVPPLKKWSSETDESFEIIFALDHAQEGDSLTEWCQNELPKEALIVHGEFGNPGETRNLGLEKVSHDWVAFVDSDDYFDSDAAAKAIKEFGKESDLIICNYYVMDENYKLKFKANKPSNLANLFPELGFWRILYRKEFIRDIYFPKYKMGEDQVFVSRILSKGPRISFCPFVIYHYVEGEHDQISKAKSAHIELALSLRQMKSELKLTENFLDFRKLLIFRQEFSKILKFQKKIPINLFRALYRLDLRPKGIMLFIKSLGSYGVWFLKRRNEFKR